MQLFFPIVIFAQSMQLTLKSAGQNGNVAAAHIPAAARRCEGMNCDDGKQTLPRGIYRGQAPACASVSPTLGCQRSGGNLLSWCHWRGKDGGSWGNFNCDFCWEGGREGGSGVELCNVVEGAVLHHLGGEQWRQSCLPLPCAHGRQRPPWLPTGAFPKGKKGFGALP